MMEERSAVTLKERTNDYPCVSQDDIGYAMATNNPKDLLVLQISVSWWGLCSS